MAWKESMPHRQQILHQLVAMSRALGDPAKEYVILAEGNTSARVDEETFFVKASGMQLASIEEGGLVEVRFRDVLALLDKEHLSDEQIRAGLEAAKVDPECPLRPSVETILHARALSSGAAMFVGHTHPTMVNAVLCSRGAEEAFAGRLFPDEIVVCGPAPVYVPYTDPGLPLARAVWAAVERHADVDGQWPKVVLLQNHGLIAFGQSASEVVDITAMAVKTAQVLLGTYALGGPQFLPASQVARLDARPDEEYRRRVLSLDQRNFKTG
jgi:rhamnose utilization protein RhaD (predicted bifunctional aldolase and dehydrogenase)